MDSVDIFRGSHPKAAEYPYFSSSHGTFSKIGHMLGHRTSLNNCKKIEIISSIFSEHKAMKSRNQSHREHWKIHKDVELNNILLNNKRVNKKIKEESKRYLETN